MQDHQSLQQSLSHPASLLACLINEPKTTTAWYEAVIEATEQRIEPGAFSRMVARLERRGWIETLRTEQPLPLYQITDPGLQAIAQAETHHQGEKLQEREYSNFRTGREIIMRLVLWILCLYPPAWRKRYEAEMVALLEQHDITFWTGLDLLLGALSAHLDPYYRGLRQPHRWKRLQRSWKVMGSACIAFCLAFFLWFTATWDLGTSLNPGQSCSSVAEPALCMRVAVTVLTPVLSSAIESILAPLALIVFLLFLALVAGWILSQMKREPGRNVLRLLALLALIPLLLAVTTGPWWMLVIAVACVALVVESGGALLASGCRTFYHADKEQRTAQRRRARRDDIGFAQSILASLVLVLLFMGVGFVFHSLFFFAPLVVIACVTLVGEARLSSRGRTVSHADEGQTTAQRGRVMRDVISLVFALSIAVSMVLLCIAQGAELAAWWKLFPQFDLYDPGLTILLTVAFAGMVLATLTALVVFARGAWALRAVYATPPRLL